MSNQRGLYLYAPALWGLTLLFGLRILAQPLSRIMPGLPEFDAWHGSVLPYSALLFFQLAIAATMVVVNLLLVRGDLVPRPRLGHWLSLMGMLYFTSMLLRLVLGQTLYSGSSWIDRPLPTLFHLVLASWPLLIAHYHAHHAR